MRACWMFIILLSCRSSHATNSETHQLIDACNDKLQIVCVPARDNVSVPCPKLTGQDMTYNLYKDGEVIHNQEVIHNRTCFRDEKAPNCNPRYSSTPTLGVELHENTENKTFTFILTGVNASSYGFYRCEVAVMYPPPFKRDTSWILVRVEGHQCKFNKDSSVPETGRDQKKEFLWIWILGLVVLFIYGVIVTIFAVITWVKWRRSDSQTDYMNTKPKAPRNRKKKRGVQIPIPRHF